MLGSEDGSWTSLCRLDGDSAYGPDEVEQDIASCRLEAETGTAAYQWCMCENVFIN